jgi:molybdopterin-guanine dinucleotide biosynthesis protein A
MNSTARCAGLLLCGGSSRRMGQPKAAMPFGKTTLLARTLATLEATCEPVFLICSLESTPLAKSFGRPVVQDLVPDEGPLRGLATGLDALDKSIPAAVVVACDLPFLTSELLRAMQQRLGDADAVVIRTQGGPHPLCAVYRHTVGPLAIGLLVAGERRMSALLERLRVRWIEDAELATLDPDGRALWNCNTPEDYARCLQFLDETRLPDQQIGSTPKV